MASERDERPWGDYEVVDHGEGYLVKRITVRRGQRISYQRHRLRAEHWFVVSGRGVATVDDEERPVSQGSVVDVAVGSAHRVASNDGGDLTFIEIQTGDYLGEDDIERLEDDYGRDLA